MSMRIARAAEPARSKSWRQLGPFAELAACTDARQACVQLGSKQSKLARVCQAGLLPEAASMPGRLPRKLPAQATCNTAT